MTPEIPSQIQEHIPLAPHTTIGLGGTARYYASCKTEGEIISAVVFARDRGLKIFILGGGSNVIVSDTGFDGLVVHIETRGVLLDRNGEESILTASAGEAWDHFVDYSVQQGLAGLECLSGIPGSVGATPIQNVGAYGQDVSQTIVRVLALDVETLKHREFQNSDCRFGYRKSRFKAEDAGHFLVLSVSFRLSARRKPTIVYPELQKYITATYAVADVPGGHQGLTMVRDSVLALRRRKSMLIDPTDDNSRSVGSFFTNPVVPKEVAARLKEQWSDLPVFPVGERTKLAAAWLVEHAGFSRGYRQGGAAVSENHSLALVNRGTTSTELLALAGHIQSSVLERFGIQLEREPVVLG